MFKSLGYLLAVFLLMDDANADDAAKTIRALHGAEWDEYSRRRDRLIERGDEARRLLQQAASNKELTVRERWLATVLHERCRQPDLFRRTQEEFSRKLSTLYARVGSHFRGSGWASDVGTVTTLLLPNEEPPAGRREWARDERKWFVKTRLSESTVLRAALAEVALKGCKAPFVEGARAPSPMHFRFGAMILVAKLGDKRTCALALAFLRDETLDVRHRASAATWLGRLKCPEALTPLLELCSGRVTPPGLRVAAFDGLGALGSKKAIPALKKIVVAGAGAKREPGNIGPYRWALEANKAIRRIKANSDRE